MRVDIKGTLTFELHGRSHVANITGVAFSNPLGKHQYTTNLEVHYKGTTLTTRLSFRVDARLNTQQRAAYIESLFANRIGEAAATWPSPWPNIRAIFVEIDTA